MDRITFHARYASRELFKFKNNVELYVLLTTKKMRTRISSYMITGWIQQGEQPSVYL
jgi:hypothetical protein